MAEATNVWPTCVVCGGTGNEMIRDNGGPGPVCGACRASFRYINFLLQQIRQQSPKPSAGANPDPPNEVVVKGNTKGCFRTVWLIVHNLLVHPLLGLWSLLTIGLVAPPKWLDNLHDWTYPGESPWVDSSRDVDASRREAEASRLEVLHLRKTLETINQTGHNPADFATDLIGRSDRYERLVERLADMANTALRMEIPS
jgi:hypothetical protein